MNPFTPYSLFLTTLCMIRITSVSRCLFKPTGEVTCSRSHSSKVEHQDFNQSLFPLCLILFPRHWTSTTFSGRNLTRQFPDVKTCSAECGRWKLHVKRSLVSYILTVQEWVPAFRGTAKKMCNWWESSVKKCIIPQHPMFIWPKSISAILKWRGLGLPWTFCNCS